MSTAALGPEQIFCGACSKWTHEVHVGHQPTVRQFHALHLPSVSHCGSAAYYCVSFFMYVCLLEDFHKTYLHVSSGIMTLL